MQTNQNGYDVLILKELWSKVNALLTPLSDRDKEIILQNICDNKPLSHIGKQFSISREQVRRIRNNALDKLRRRLKRFDYV